MTEETIKGRCKDCKHFDYDGVLFIPSITVVPEVCWKWGDGCKTEEDGYCFLFEGKGETE
jgi:hypothetical protein